VHLEGKTAIVTGAARGIGRACAVRLAARGIGVAVLDRDLDSGAAYEDESPGTTMEEIGAIGFQADLTDEHEAKRAIEEAVAALGRLDFLINVAGGAITPYAQSLPSITPTDHVRTLFDVNFMTMLHCCQAAIPALRVTQGAIVNFSSTAAISVFPDGSNSAYAAVKAALAHFTRHLAAELGPDGIRVNAVAPGIIKTPGTGGDAVDPAVVAHNEARIPMGRLGEPHDIGRVVLFLASGLAGYLTGSQIVADGGVLLA
jgi:NAD(P)-dependent dehydrogenase (short-subunit alcohol dehydrogenase family)